LLDTKRTALDDYIAKADATYTWRVEKTIKNGDLTTVVIQLNTHTWRTEEDVDRPVWEHWLVLTIPAKVTTDRAFLMIGGGSHNSKTPDGSDVITS